MRGQDLTASVGPQALGRISSPGLNFAGLATPGRASNWALTFPSCLCPRPGPDAGLYWRIWHMDLIQSAVLYSVMTLVSTYLVAFAYKNVKFVLKHK